MGIKERMVGLSSTYQEPYPVEVVGESSYRNNIEKICGYFDEEEGYNDDSHVAVLYLEDDNPHDPNNAVRVAIDNLTVGYLPKAAASAYRKRLVALGAPIDAIGVCAGSIRGGYLKKDGEAADFGVRLDFDLKEFTLERVRYEDEWIYPPGVTPEPEVKETTPAIAPPPTADKTTQPEKPAKNKQSSKIWLVVLAVISIILGGAMAAEDSSTFTGFLSNGAAYSVVIFGLLLLGRWFIARRRKK